MGKRKEQKKAEKAYKAKKKRLSERTNLAGLKKGPVEKRKSKEERKADKAYKAKKKRLGERTNLAGLKKGPVAKKAYVKKMNAGAAAEQLKDLGNPSSAYEKKGYARKHGHAGKPVKKTVARVARDYAANAAYDAEHGYSSAAKYEKQKLMHVVNRIAGSKNR